MKKQRKHFALRNRRSRGMSLIQIVELIVVVIGIIGLIAAAVGVNVMGSCVPARSRALNEIRYIQSALDLYKVKKGQYPDPGAGLKVLVDSEDLKEIPLDPWGGEFDYLLEGDKPVIISYGADKAPGGEGEDEDISSKTL